MSLEDSDRSGFIDRANNLLDDHDVGNHLLEEDPDNIKDLFTDLQTDDVETVMNFLIDEEVIAFE